MISHELITCNSFVRNLGSTLGLAVCGTVMCVTLLIRLTMLTKYFSNNILASSLSSLDLDSQDSKSLLGNPEALLNTVSSEEADRIRAILVPAYRKGFRVIFLIGASMSALAFVLSFVLMPQIDLSRPDDSRLKEEGRRAYEENRKKDLA